MNFLDFPCEVVREIVLSAPDAKCFLQWLLVCKDTAFSVSEKDRKEVKKRFEDKTCDLWWYYDHMRFKTGAICLTEEEAIYHVKRNWPAVGEKRMGTLCKVTKIPFYGTLSGERDQKIYILRYPPSAYSNENRACRAGLEHSWSTRGTLYWNRRSGNSTVCDREWVMKLSDGENLDWKKAWEEFVARRFSPKSSLECAPFCAHSLEPDVRCIHHCIKLRSHNKNMRINYAEDDEQKENGDQLCGATTKKGLKCKNKKGLCRYHKN